jgi:predicted GTPase
LDALRPGHEKLYYPGEVNLRRADVLMITKVNEGSAESLERVVQSISVMNPGAEVLKTGSFTRLDHPEWIRGKKVLVIEDGPTITHGGMASGAGASASMPLASELIDPRPFAVGTLRGVYEKYPHIGRVLPAMGYSGEQMRDLEDTIERSPCDAVVIATPADLRRNFRISRPVVRASYDFDVDLAPLVSHFLKKNRIVP